MPQPQPPDSFDPGSGMTRVVERNIAALLERRRLEESRKRWQDRIADAITRFTGSMPFVFIHLGLFGAWILANLPGVPLPKWDPTYVVLAMFASVEAIFLSTFVLISQNRMAALSEKRAELDLQVSLLTEHELTQLVTLVRRLALKLSVQEAEDPALAEAEQHVRPEKVLDTMDRINEASDSSAPAPAGG